MNLAHPLVQPVISQIVALVARMVTTYTRLNVLNHAHQDIIPLLILASSAQLRFVLNAITKEIVHHAISVLL